MGAHFAAVQRAFPSHPLLHEGMAGFVLDRHAAGGANHIQRIPGQPGVVDDLGAGMPDQQGFRQQPNQIITLDETTRFIEEETAVEITVPGQPQVGPMFAHRLCRGIPAFRQQGIGNTVREGTIRLVVDFDELERQVRLQGIDDRAGAAVAGVDHDLQRLERGAFEITQQVVDISVLALAP